MTARSPLLHRRESPQGERDGAADSHLSANGEASLPSASEGLDAESLDRLRELDPSGTSHLLQRVFQAFESSLARLSPALEEARAAADLNGIRQVAHTLKSSSASIGALRLAQLCAEIERMIRQGDPDRDVLTMRVGQMQAETAVVLRVVAQLSGVPT